MASPSSSPSESPLAFSYDWGVHEVAYPLGHDQSRPQTPASATSAGPGTRHYPQRNGAARPNSLPALDLSRLSSQSKHQALDSEEEYEMRGEGGTGGRGSEEIDPFSKGELVVMSGSSLLVLALIAVSVMLTLGKIAL